MIVFSADSEVDACKILVCGGSWMIGRVLPARHIDGPGDDGRATPLHDRDTQIKRSRPTPRGASQSCKVGFGRRYLFGPN
jgi:hypothetical protein